MPLTSHVLLGYRQLWLSCGIVLGLLVLFSGCDDDAPSAVDEEDSHGTDAASVTKTPPNQPARPAAAPSFAKPADGKTVLEEMAQTYREARSYQDEGLARISYKLDGKEEKHEFPFALSFAAPNKLKLAAYEGQVVSDGKNIFAEHASVPGYVRVHAAPERLSPQHLFADAFFWSQLNERQAGGPVQVELLFNDKFIETLLAGGKGAPQLGEAKDVDGELCHGVELEYGQEQIVYWVGERSRLLRRIDFPTDELRKMLEQDGQVSDLEAAVHFKDARINTRVDETEFRFQRPSGAKDIKQFVGPAPPAMLGQKLEGFEFTALDGGKIDAASLEGKIVVIDFWATWCQYCLEKLPHVEQAYQKFKDDDKVRFLAVSVDQPEIKNDAVAQKLDELKIGIPAARDTQFAAFTKFNLPGVPAMIVLGANGTVQDIAVGLTPEGVDPVADLTAKVEALLEGKDLYQRILDEFEQAMQQDPPPVSQDAGAQPEVKIAERSEPQNIVLQPLWNKRDIAHPGNLLVVEGEDGPRILVIEGYRAIAELNVAGDLLHRHDPKLPQQASIAFLRTAVDTDGRRWFAASAVGGQQVFILDDNFAMKAAFPAEPAEDDAIGDAQFVDLDGDGALEIAVGRLGKKGVALVSIDGELKWADPNLEDVVSLAVGSADEQGRRELMCVFPPGTIARFDHAGQRVGEPQQVESHYLRLLMAAGSNATSGEFAGMSYAAGDDGAVTDVLVGIKLADGDKTGKATWTYPLPTGQQPWLEQLLVGRIVGNDSHWIVAAADGSLHFASFQGKPLDRFNTGAAIAGFAVLASGDERYLILSGETGVSAWKAKDK